MPEINDQWQQRQFVLDLHHTHTTTLNDRGNNSLIVKSGIEAMGSDNFVEATRWLAGKNLIVGHESFGGGLTRPHITERGIELYDRNQTLIEEFGPREQTPDAPTGHTFHTTINQTGGQLQMTQGHGNTMEMTVSLDEQRIADLIKALAEAGESDLSAAVDEAQGDPNKLRAVLTRIGDWFSNVSSGAAANAITPANVAKVAAALLAIGA